MNTNFIKLIKIYIFYWANFSFHKIWTIQNFGFLNFDGSKQVCTALDGLKLKSHEYQKFITCQDIQTLFG
jgi:hypothetical protein